LFHNWLPAGIRYYLIKVGLLRVGGIEVVCRDGSKGLIPARAYGVLVNDYYDGYATGYNCVESVATYMNKVRVPIEETRLRGSLGIAVKNGWVYDMVGRFWLRDNVRFRHTYRSILEIFDYGEYEPLSVEGRVVVDVGAFVGDSAIYFALKGARRVIAIEPHPSAYSEMLDNIKLNNLEDVVVPVNAGLASRPGKVCVEDSDVSDTLVIYHRPGDCPNAVPAVTLSKLMDRFGIGPDDAVLKMDCEGCEFDVILSDYEHVRLFRELIFEYHSYTVNRPVDDLLSMLSTDYKCEMRGNNKQGIMHCVRE
jgi:FkbM family methyltransferase